MNANVLRKKLRLGLVYGIVAGLAFACLAWGMDALLLVKANAAYSWVKVIPGLIICILAGGIVGWLTILIQRHLFSLLLWGMVAILYSWLVVWLPFSVTPRLVSLLDPSLAALLNYNVVLNVGQFRVISLIIISLAALICGLLEINLIDQAILSPYLSASVAALVVCVILFGLAGSATDQMINTSLREPVQAINTLLQFAQDNIGAEVSKETARSMHLSATRQLGELILLPRRLILIGFDENLLMVDVLVEFGRTKVKCSTIYSQPTDCTILPSNP